jgi:predicted phosphodiesterase
MQVAVISDLHLGRGGPTDAFQHDDGEFLRFLRFLESNFEKIVLLGDIWETLTAPPFARAQELRAAQQYHGEIHRRFRLPQYQYVHGNHDLVAGRLEGAPEEYALQSDGIRLLFSHGHQGDDLCSKARLLSEAGVWLGAWLRRLGLCPIYSYFADLEKQRSTLGKCLVHRWAVRHASRREADIIVTGHTHRAAKASSGPHLFLNSGSCSEGNISFLSLDTKRQAYEVHSGF